MFGRRVFASTPIPRHMWHKLHINNSAQAMRMLPSFAPLASVAGGKGPALSTAWNPATASTTVDGVSLESAKLSELWGLTDGFAALQMRLLATCMEKAFLLRITVSTVLGAALSNGQTYA